MKKILKKVVASISLLLITAISGLITIIFFPEPLFAYKHEYKQFNVYSSILIENEIDILLENALILAKSSELYDPNYQFDVFLAHQTLFNTIDDQFLGHQPTARATDNNIVIKVAIDVKNNLFFPTFYQKCEGNLTYLLAHEMIHNLQANKYGKLKFNPFNPPEYWKLEGYPEYISRQDQLSNEHYSFIKEINRYVHLENKLKDNWIDVEEQGCKSPKYYYKGRLMIEYLMDIKKLSYDQILSDTTAEKTIFHAMLDWKESIQK